MTTHTETISQKYAREVAAGAALFESRWTMLALQRLDPGLAEALADQAARYHEAQFMGEARDIAVEGAALVRGYHAAASAMERAQVSDDAYVIGRCPKTGTVVAIGQQKHAIERVRTLYGEDVVWITPDEVASLFGAVEDLKAISAIKRRFPGAEVIHRYAGEPAQADQ